MAAFFVERHNRPELCVINAGPAGPLTVRLDGAEVARALPATAGEEPRAVVRTRVKAGRHRLEVLDARGAVVDERELDAEPGRAYLYAPGTTTQSACFAVRNVTRDGDRSERPTPLAPGQVLWPLRERPAGWFGEEARVRREVREWETLTVVRRVACPATR